MKKSELSELPQLVQEYLNYLDAVKSQSELTILEYASDLRTFFRFLFRKKNNISDSVSDEDLNIKNIDIEFIKNIKLTDAYSYLSYCKNERKNNETTRARKVVAIRRFYYYICDKCGYIKDNPMKTLDIPKIKKSQPKYLTLEESEKLLSVIDGKNKERDYAIITLFLNCGIRLAELVSINYNDIRTDDSILITGKGNKERIVYLNSACKSAVEEYMKVRQNDGVKTHALFLSSRNTRISPKTVQHIVYTYLDKAGFGNRGLSVHKLRHTAATLMYQYGDVDLLVLKEILGHENLGTTEIYTHLANDATKKAIESNPLSSKNNKSKD